MEKPIFAPAFWRELAAACPLGPCEPEVVESWFEIAWPKINARNYRNTKRAVAAWWSRVAQYELDQAQQRLYAMGEKAESDELEAMAKRANDVEEILKIQNGLAKLRVF